MSAEQLKVLEMVAEGKISPEEGVRLLKALGDNRSGRVMGVDLPDITLPKIDLGQLGEMCVELKNSVVDGAKKAQGTLRRTRMGRFTELKDFPVSIEWPQDIQQCNLRLDTRAGKCKLSGGDAPGRLLLGKLKRAIEEPIIQSDRHDGQLDLRIRQNLGRASYTLNKDMAFKVAVDNAAAETDLNLGALLVDELTIDNNAGSVNAHLGERAPLVRASIQNNAGSVTLGVPGTFAVKVTPTGSLSSHNLERCGLEIIEGCAVSGDYETNAKRVDIVLNQNVSSFKLEWRRSDGVEVGAEPHLDDDDAPGADEAPYDMGEMH